MAWNRSRLRAVHYSWVVVFFFFCKRIGVKSKLEIFFLQTETLLWQSRLKLCLLSCTRDTQKSKVCLPNCSVILKSNTKWWTGASRSFFLWKETSHKWLLPYSPQLWQRSRRPTINGERVMVEWKKEVNGKMWVSSLQLPPSLLRLSLSAVVVQ